MKAYKSVIIHFILTSNCLAIYEKKRNNPKSMSEITDFQSVTHFGGIESYYRGLREENEQGSTPLEPTAWRKRADIKKKICKSVLTSYFFEMRSEQHLDTDLEEVRSEMMRDEELSDTFASMYTVCEKPSCWFFFWGGDDGYKYENAYKERTVRVGIPTFTEHTFACVARSSAGRIRDYFVTREYNVNLAYDGMPVLGRFIFSRDFDGNLTLVALAEEAAVESNILRQSSLIEMMYIAARSDEKRKGLGPTTDTRDPVCGLTSAEKLRLCSSVFSATAERYFRKNVPSFKKDGFVFKPIMNEGLNCEMKTVSLQTPGSGTFGGWLTGKFLRIFGALDSERMIACEGFNRQGSKIVYYVARGEGEKNNVFVFYNSAPYGSVSLFNYFMNVSVVDQTVE